MARIQGTDNSRFVGRSVRIDTAQDMRRYDRLPREVRDALKGLASDYACVGLKGLLKRGISPCALADSLKTEDHRNHIAFMRYEFCGRVPEEGEA